MALKGPTSYSQTVGAQASVAFKGDAVAVYGGVSYDHGNYTVDLDGQSQIFNGGTARMYHAQVRAIQDFKFMLR